MSRAPGGATSTAATVRPGTSRAARFVPLLLAVATAALLGLGAPAAAHARLVGTDPADGTVLAASPATITLTFDEAVGLREDAVRLLDSTGEQVPVRARSVDTSVVVEPGSELPDGTYVLTFRVVSGDSHPVTGGSTFSVGAPSAGFVPGTATGTDPALVAVLVVGQALAYAGLLVGAGLVLLVVLVAGPGGVTGGLVLLARVAWGVAVLAHVLLVPLTAVRQDGGPVLDLLRPGSWLGGEPGGWWTAVAVAVGGLASLAVLRPGAGVTRRGAAAALAGAGLALGSLAAVGHTRSVGPAWLVLGADLAHVVAAATWTGGLVGLVLLARALRPVDLAPVLTRFSALAGWTVAVLTVSGGLLAWQVTGLRDGFVAGLLGSDHGRVLLAKTALVGLVLLVAGWNRWRLLPAVRRDPAGATRRVRRTVRTEAGGLGAVLAVTGLLVISSPATAGPSTPTMAPEALVVVEPLEDGELTLTLTPGSVGVNALEIELTDGAGRPFEPVDAPTVALSLPAFGVGPLERPVSRTGSGAFLATVDAPLPGTWEVQVSVRTSTFDNPVLTVPVEIG